MAKLDGISSIYKQDSNIALDIYTTLHRSNSLPIDSTEIFLNANTAKNYAAGQNTGNIYQGSACSYPGQHITILSVDPKDNTNSIATMYQIQNTKGDLKKILAEPLKGVKFDFNNKSLGDILVSVITELGGTAENYD